MTNAQIILIESVKLMEEGIIGTSGRQIKTLDGRIVDEPEEIHTFAVWKSLGYNVKAGEHAIAKFPIWKYTSKKVEDENGEETDRTNMFLKTSAFFKKSQVERMDVK